VPIFGRWMRWVGGIPVDRSAPGGLVGQTVDYLRGAAAQGRFAWLALAPEGTRRLTDGWRSGFYRVAVQAQVPVCVAALDFGRREVRVNTFVQLCGDPALDMAAIETALQQPRGCNPAQASPIRLS
jgi:1-acyl-sn-glycerol-3-phosphate acyltransferase